MNSDFHKLIFNPGNFTPGASSSTWAPSLGQVAGISSLDDQPRSPVRASTALVPLGSTSAAQGNISQNSPQSLVAGSPTPSSPGLVAGQLQGQSRLLERCFSPHSSSELQVKVEAMQLEKPGQQREGELKVGSGAAGEKILSEQEQLNSSELPVLCLEGGLVRVKYSALSQLRSVNVLNVPREMAGNELWHQPLVEMAIVPCIDSAGGEGCEWLGGPVVDSESSGLQVGLMGEASRSLTPGGAGLVEFKEGERAEDVGSPLNAYSPALGGLGYSEWVMQSANEIYPIVGMTFVGHKLQLLAFLTCIEEERRLGNGRTKGKREIKNLESSINYDAKGSGLIRGKRRARGLVVVP